MKNNDTRINNPYSRTVTQDDSLPAAQAMLHAIGLDKQKLALPFVGIASTGYEGNPCNMHLNSLAQQVKTALPTDEVNGLIFNTIGISDGISMGTTGMNYSLPSRDLIADSMESVVAGMHYDALVTVVGCDKNLPGALMAMLRLNRPSLMLYGGSIAPGCHKGKKLDVVSAFEAWGEKVKGEINQEDYQAVIENACPGAGACGGMYTANTMSAAAEAMGMSLPYSASNPATSQEKNSECQSIARALRYLMAHDIKPRDVVTRASLFNAFRVITVLGGSTNAVLHLLAIAHAAEIPLALSDLQNISRQTPMLADLKPSGRYLMEDLHHAGGVPAVMKLMLEHGLLDGSCMTVTGRSVAENLAQVPPLAENQRVIKPPNKAIKKAGHIQILTGRLAPEGSVAKITGKEGERFVGSARVYDSEAEANQGIKSGEVVAGDVVVIRYVGPKGGPGMPEMLKPTAAIMGAGLGKDVALITDGRFSGGSHGFVVGHISPEAQLCGPIALVETGDEITIDAKQNLIDVAVDEAEWAKRKAAWQQPKQTAVKGILAKYARLVASASMGCITDGDETTGVPHG